MGFPQCCSKVNDILNCNKKSNTSFDLINGARGTEKIFENKNGKWCIVTSFDAKASSYGHLTLSRIINMSNFLPKCE